MTATTTDRDPHAAARAAWEAATGRPMGSVGHPRTNDLYDMPEAAPVAMRWVWADRPNRRRDAYTIATATDGAPGYRYWHGTPGAWRLIATVITEADALMWWSHRTEPAPAPADVAVWLDGVAETMPADDVTPYAQPATVDARTL